MFKMSTLLIVLLAVFSGAIAGIGQGSNNEVVQKALDYVSKFSMDTLATLARSIPIPDQSGQAGKVSWRITNIVVRDFTKPSSKVELINNGRGLRWTATNAGVKLHCDWWARYKNWLLRTTKSGSLDASASGVSFSVTVNLGRDSNGQAFVRPAGCTSSVGNIDFDLHGGGWLVSLANWLLNFERKAEEKVKGLLPAKLCTALNSAITSLNTKAKKELNSILDRR
ncbi:lipopolysaccharide-binding protein-like isoform X2 [Littorina saxatilis]|uniref:Lipid-binding serum glycoprotein N-terminal domain-containing protein n=1 Tax=Littorina saxatilis TaxID=31220 RepID=A0AAN9BZN1_9CAEN